MGGIIDTVWKRARTGIAVLGITFLIWFAADQNVMETKTFTVSVKITSAAPDIYAGFTDAPYTKTLAVTMSGRRRRVRDFEELVKPPMVFEVEIDRTKSVKNEPQLVSAMDDVLARIRQVRQSRLTIRDVQPRNLSVRVDRYTKFDNLRVEPDYGDLRVQAEVRPDIVSVSLPEFVARDPTLAARPIATAIAEQRIREAAEPNGRFSIVAPLKLEILEQMDPNIRAQFSPSAEVRILGNIQALTETRSIGPIQIKWYTPDEIQREFVIVQHDANFRVHIDVTGPKGRIEHLDPGDILGLVEVKAADLNDPGPGVEISRRVRFILPKKYSDCAVSPEGQSYEIRFKLEPRRGANGDSTQP